MEIKMAENNIEKNKTYYETSRENKRKKRVQRMKSMIVGVIVLFLVIPAVCCALMFFKVHKLEEKVDRLVGLRSEKQADDTEEGTDKTSSNGSVAQAAEIETTEVEDTDEEPEESLTPVSGDEELESTDGEKELTPEEVLEINTEKKKVYLTFDDGPGQYTNDILDVLKEYDVKATFFVVGRTDEASLAAYKRIVEEGHTLAMHSYTHDYSGVYKSLKSFKKDIQTLSDLLYETTGVRTTYYRFPGGSSNTVSKVSIKKCISYLNKEGITYFDWNVVNGDATGKNYTAKQLTANVMEGVHQNNNSMVLMHDTVSKDTTLKSLPSLIKKLQKEGYVLLPISEYTNPVQHIKADSVE
jgi:peptidoglycan/xylan/chitin deacetylase (PgdA/CDA1 family)